MPLRIQCPCGKVLKVADKLVGTEIRCPACGTLQNTAQTAKRDDPGFEVVEDDCDSEPMAAANPKAKRISFIVEEKPEFREEPPPRPKKRKFRNKKTDHSPPENGGWFSADRMHISRVTLIGLLVMVIAVYFFISTLFTGFINIPSIFAFVAGFLTVLKGMIWG
ncbi:MAG: hypothetical protein U0798_13745 [Gemmataceae bacterium]